MDMRQQMAASITELMGSDNRVVVVLADISTELFAQAAQRYPLRIINVGIMEQTMISVAAGLALEGFIPIAHSIAPFVVERPFEQLKDDFCYQGLGGNFISIGASYDYSTSGMTHHAPGDVQVLRTLPGMQIVVPGTAAELDTLVQTAYANGAPTYYRLSTRANTEAQTVRFGAAEILRRGERATVIAVGPALDCTLAAVAGLDVSVLYYTTVAPFDATTLREVAATETVVLVEPFYAGTLVADVCAALAPRAVRIEAIGVPREVLSRYGTSEQHDAAIGFTPADIRERIARLVRRGEDG
jgi:transketolase